MLQIIMGLSTCYLVGATVMYGILNRPAFLGTDDDAADLRAVGTVFWPLLMVAMLAWWLLILPVSRRRERSEIARVAREKALADEAREEPYR